MEMILAFAFIFAVLLGGYKAVSVYRSQSDVQAFEEVRNSYARALEVYNKNMESCKREIDNLTQDISGLHLGEEGTMAGSQDREPHSSCEETNNQSAHLLQMCKEPRSSSYMLSGLWLSFCEIPCFQVS